MNHGVSSWLPTVIFVPLVGWALYRKVSKTFRRQPMAPKRMVLRMILLSITGVLFLAWIPTFAGISAAATGMIVGIALATYGLVHTRFEVTPAGTFYTPNKWIALVVTALLLGRLAGRMFSVYEAGAAPASGAAPGAGLHRSPLTLGIFFLMATYYVAYDVGVLKKGRAIERRESASAPLP